MVAFVTVNHSCKSSIKLKFREKVMISMFFIKLEIFTVTNMFKAEMVA